MAIKLAEHTHGSHIYMRMRLDSGRVEEIDVYIRADGETYHTSADNNPDHPRPKLRAEIIRAFNELY